MDIAKLLEGIECSCGKKHSCDIERVVIGKNALSETADIAEKYSNILLIADNNTYAVCGERVKALLGDRVEYTLIFETDGFLVPDETAIKTASEKITEKTDFVIGIGSGVIQDLCKYVSFDRGLRYCIIATAPSMDGYASKGAAMITGNMKVTYNARVPQAIIADTDILKNAPMDMIKSGYGDILGKFSCLNDWKLSRTVNGEYLCEYVYDLAYEMLNKTKDLGAKLLARDEEAVKALTEALIGVGIAMAYVGNSRPASGSEHHLSHYFEVVGIMRNEPYFMHGTDVAFSAVYTQKLREEIIKIDKPRFAHFDKTEWEKDIRRVYFEAADGVIELQNRLGWYSEDKSKLYAEKWGEIREVLSEAPTSDEMLGYLESIELDITDFEKTYGAEKISNAVRYAKDLKDRYSVLWLGYCIEK